MRSYPWVLGYSLQGNLEPTVAFLGTVVGAANVGALVRAQPSLLGCSLEGNLEPTAARLTEAGIAISGRLLVCSLDECINPRLKFCAELGVPALPSDFTHHSWEQFRRRARKRVASTAVAAIPSRDDAVPAPASAPATGRPG